MDDVLNAERDHAVGGQAEAARQAAAKAACDRKKA